MCLGDHRSKWALDIYVGVDKEVPGVENVILNGKFITKVYEWPYSDTSKWMKDYDIYIKEQGLSIKKMYMWYVYCPIKTAMHKAAQAGGTAAEEKVEKRKMAGNFMAGQTADSHAGFEKAEKVEKVAPQTAGQTVNPVQMSGKSGLALLAIISIMIFALTQCGG